MSDVKRGIYKNNKKEDEYLVLGTGTDCTNSRSGEKCIIYTPYDSFDPDKIFTREINEFKEKFTFDRNY